jgi:hypothetical protein
MASTSAFIIARSAFEVVEAMADKIGGTELIAWGKALSNSLHSSICKNISVRFKREISQNEHTI